MNWKVNKNKGNIRLRIVLLVLLFSIIILFFFYIQNKNTFYLENSLGLALKNPFSFDGKTPIFSDGGFFYHTSWYSLQTNPDKKKVLEVLLNRLGSSGNSQEETQSILNFLNLYTIHSKHNGTIIPTLSDEALFHFLISRQLSRTSDTYIHNQLLDLLLLIKRMNNDTSR